MNNDERDNQSSIDFRQRECRWLLDGRTVARIIQLIIKLTAWPGDEVDAFEKSFWEINYSV